MNLTYQYRIYPTDEQIERLDFLLRQGRWVYNNALALKRGVYARSKTTVHKYALAKHFATQKRSCNGG